MSRTPSRQDSNTLPETQVGTQDPAEERILSSHTLKTRYRSKAEVVCGLLREAILTGEMAPGQRIVVDTLSADLGISKIPIREAISHLAAEGLVELTPHVGARVSAPLSARDLMDIYAVRATLEEMATSLAAQHIGEEDLRRLREITDEIEQRIGTIDRNTWSRLNRQFHTIIFAASGNRILAEFCEEILNRSARYRGAAMHLRLQAERLVGEHRGLLEALEQRDAISAAALARRHVENSGLGVWRRVEAQGPTVTTSPEDIERT